MLSAKIPIPIKRHTHHVTAIIVHLKMVAHPANIEKLHNLGEPPFIKNIKIEKYLGGDSPLKPVGWVTPHRVAHPANIETLHNLGVPPFIKNIKIEKY